MTNTNVCQIGNLSHGRALQAWLSMQRLRANLVCRGKFRSKSRAAILEEANILVKKGAKELNLIAEDTNQWGLDRKDGLGLAELLRDLSKIEGLRWIRLLYCYPSYFTEDLIDEIAQNDKVSYHNSSVRP